MSELGSLADDPGSNKDESDSIGEAVCICNYQRRLSDIAKYPSHMYDFNKKLYCICQQEYKHGNLMFQCEGKLFSISSIFQNKRI